ncbi:MAG TPA: GNAT family N-acetyltransferase [Terriglobia bacterium]|nr:GNAT family N-acetyltransferase [Terriglobia bacterium]
MLYEAPLRIPKTSFAKSGLLDNYLLMAGLDVPYFKIDPITDQRWPDLVRNHPQASAFHGRSWLSALQRTYGYTPVALTTSAPGEALSNALVFCAIRSRLTGNRLVSLPFSDHCEPLVESAGDLARLLDATERFCKAEQWRYAELRPIEAHPDRTQSFQEFGSYYLHRIDLTPELDDLLRRFHKDCVQRKIRRAERENLKTEAGRDERLLNQLFRLLVVTRRRHRVPPQPFQWFRNLIECFGDDLVIRIASRDEIPVAGILTLRAGNRLIYKYGGSDVNLNRLGGMALLFWEAIRDAKRDGLSEFDLGRTDCDNPGLATFKEHWAARRSPLVYWRHQSDGQPARHVESWKNRLARGVFSRMPDALLVRAGAFLYRHVG